MEASMNSLSLGKYLLYSSAHQSLEMLQQISHLPREARLRVRRARVASKQETARPGEECRKEEKGVL